jgi:tetratricopeptide (TPR) repeat protein
MLIQNLKLLLRLYYRPLSALSSILDEGSLLFGAVAATVVAVALHLGVTSTLYRAYESAPAPARRITRPGVRQVSFQSGPPPVAAQGDDESDGDEYDYVPRWRRQSVPVVGDLLFWFVSFRPLSYFTIALSLAVLYVPATLLALALVERGASFRLLFQRDYAALLACTFMSWVAAHLPFALAGLALQSSGLSAEMALLLWLAAKLCFGVLMAGALHVACGASVGKAALVVGVSWVAMSFDSWLYAVATFSPFLTLIWLLPLALGAYAGLSAAYRQRQRFRHNLEASTVNARDSEAQYQLGLLHQQRRQYAEAVTRFRRAVEIDPRETDAHFQLGRIAREQGRLQEAIDHFGTVVTQDDKHAQSEVWREVGATYLAASMFAEARDALTRYIERRPFDPEGLYYLGETYRQMGEPERAREAFRQCVEAVKTMPYYRRNQVSKWSKLAQAQL